MSTSGAPRGRRPGSPDTRAAILDAARATFASQGRAGASVRGIAADFRNGLLTVTVPKLPPPSSQRIDVTP